MSNLKDIYLPIQRIIPFSNVEGIGNRTSIFLQGCNINCLYCHNPETIALTSPTAKLYSVEDLLTEIKNAVPFIRGITASGGEPTLYAEELTILFREVHRLGLTCYLDSNGFFAYETIFNLIKETDKFLFDIKGFGQGLAGLCFSKKYINENYVKVIETQKFKQAETKWHKSQEKDLKQQIMQKFFFRPEAQILTGSKSPKILERNFENLQKLLLLKKIEEVRLVYIKGFYEEKETVRKIVECLKEYPEVVLKLIRVHAKGARGQKEVILHMPTVGEVENLATYAKEQGLRNPIVIV